MPPATLFSIATALVHRKYKRDSQARLSLFSEMRMWLKRNEPQCRSLLSPAGYFQVGSLEEAFHVREQFVRAAGDELLTTFTFDLSSKGQSRRRKNAFDKKHQTAGNALPYYGCLIEGGTPLGDIVQQLGRTSGDIDTSIAGAHVQHRVHRSSLLENRAVVLSLCGEVLSSPWREALVEQEPSLILNPAHASVQLAGNPKRSWEPHVDELLKGLPRDTAWAFADHINQLEHRAHNQCVPLVQGGQGTRTRNVKDSGWDIPGARLYVYEVLIA